MIRKKTALLISTAMIAALATGCSSNNNAAQTDSPAPGSAAPKASTKQNVTIKFWDRHPELEAIFNKVIKDFEQKNPNIKVEFTEVPVTTQNQQYQAAVSGNSLPDVFAVSGYTVPQFVKLNQLHSLNDIITPAVQKDYPAGVFTPGYSMVGDQIYMLPMYAPYHAAEVLYYNKDILQKYNVAVPKNWDELLSAGKEIYEKSGGKTYGLVMSVKQAGGQLDQMASAIKPDVYGGFNYKTGRYEWNSEGYIQTMDYLKNLYSSKAMHPDSVTMSKAQARGALAAGQAAFEMDGDWGGSLYLGLNFNNFGATKLPTKNGSPYYMGYVGPTPEGIAVSAKTQHWEEASLFVKYLESNLFVPMVDAGLDTAKQVKPQNPQYPQIPDIMNVITDTVKALPNFYTKKPEAMDVMENFESTKTKTVITDILGGYLSGQVGNLPDALKQLSDQLNKTLDDSIKASNGKVAAKDFMFPNWTPFKPYTQADYDNLK